jgi:class 3 adenylate cyclase
MASFSRVIILEPRGFGASEGDPRDNFLPEVADADYLAATDSAGASEAVLVGWSTQGTLMIRLAALHPERVNALILINSCAHYVREDDYPWGFPRDKLDDITRFLEEAWFNSVDLDVTAPSRKSDERLRSLWGRARRSSYSSSYYTQGLRLSLEWDMRSHLPQVRCRSLILHREGDRFIHLGAGRYVAEHIDGAKFVLLPGEDHLLFVGDTDRVTDEIEEFVTGSRTGGAGVEVKTVNILFTDIVGSTEQQTRLGPREWSRLADEHEAMVRDVLARHGGHGVKSTGDGHLAIFDAAGSALRCTTEILSRAKNMGLDLRAGLHTGDVEVRGSDIGGLPVNIAKRVCDIAGPGEVLVSETLKTLLTGSGLAFTEKGPYELKGVPGSWRLYRLVA